VSRSDLEKIVGAAAVDERPVRDLWPLGIMEERAGTAPHPVLVARPSQREQLSALMQWASTRGISVTPMGGATGMCGALSPESGEIVLDMAGFDRVVEIDETNLICRCEAGVNGYALEQTLNAKGLTLGHYPSSLPGTTVGGLIATRSSGQESTYFGNIEDMVLGLGVVLPDGGYAAPRAAPRSATGPALHQLWVGAEGGLGVVLEAVLRVHRLPEDVIGKGFAFPDLSRGLECMRALVQAGVRPFVMRLYDAEDTVFNRYEVNAGECVLVVATAGARGVAQSEAAVVSDLARDARDLGEEPWQRWQRHRYDLSAELLNAFLAPPSSFLDVIEVATRWTSLLELYHRVKAAIAVGPLALCHFSHAYEQGCCAYFTFGGSSPTEEEAQAAYRRAWEGTMRAALELEGTISHHHGVGRARARWVADELGGWMRVWRAVKAGLDPAGIMNPSALGGRS